MTDGSPGITQALLDEVIVRLRADYANELEVGYYPEDPISYRLNHPVGALLLGYSRSQFGDDRDTELVWVERDLTLPLTLIFRQLNGPQGVISYLDRVRVTLTGFRPVHCDRPLRPVAEQFLSHEPGLWQYAQDWSTRTVQVQSGNPPPGAPLSNIHFEGGFQ